MSQTSIFLGNLSPTLVAVIDQYAIGPLQYIRIDDKLTISEILHSDKIISYMSSGIIELRYGGTQWSDSLTASDMVVLYSSLSTQEQALGVGIIDITADAGGGANPGPGGP